MLGITYKDQTSQTWNVGKRLILKSPLSQVETVYCDNNEAQYLFENGFDSNNKQYYVLNENESKLYLSYLVEKTKDIFHNSSNNLIYKSYPMNQDSIIKFQKKLFENQNVKVKHPSYDELFFINRNNIDIKISYHYTEVIIDREELEYLLEFVDFFYYICNDKENITFDTEIEYRMIVDMIINIQSFIKNNHRTFIDKLFLYQKIKNL